MQQPQRAPYGQRGAAPYSGYQTNPSQVQSNVYAPTNVAPVQQTQPMQYQQPPPQQPAQPQQPTQYQAPPQTDMNGLQQQAPMNTMQQQQQQVQQVQQVPQQQVQQQQQQLQQGVVPQQGGPRRAPMKAAPQTNLYEQFTNPAPVSQMQQAVPQTQTIPTVQSQQPQGQQQQMQQPNEEKAAIETQTAGAPNATSPPKGAKGAPAVATARREPPWKPFTGEKKNPLVGKYGWAHRVRQVVSPDTLRIALLKPRTSEDLLKPASVITITLDGIVVPRIQRYNPRAEREAMENAQGKNKRPKKKVVEDEVSAPAAENANDDDTKDTNKSPKSQNYGPVDADEPYAYDAREFIRSKVMNKNIFYAVWRVNNNLQSDRGVQREPRMWGDLYYQDTDRKTRSLTAELVAAGYATVKTNRRHDLGEKEVEKLQKKEKEAIAAGLGMHNGDKQRGERTVRSMEWLRGQQQNQFGQQYKGKTLSGVVDGVISGSSLRMELCLDAKKRTFKTVVVNLAGVNCPRIPFKESSNYKGRKKKDDDRRKKIERLFGAKAKEWTEERLLGQKVSVNVMFVSSNQIIAQVLSEKGRIGPSLLKKGLAEYQEWSASRCDEQEKALLKASAEMAIEQKLNIWTVMNPNQKRKEQQVTVVQIVSGDTVVVRYDRDPVIKAEGEQKGKGLEFMEERVTLSSIRTPRLGLRGRAATSARERNQQQNQRQNQQRKDGDGDDKDKKQDNRRNNQRKDPTLDEYLARDARELVREMTIGRQVTFISEYSRTNDTMPKNDARRTKKFGSIKVMDAKGNEKNVALELVKKGFAELVWHGKDESNRSSAYLELQDAYEKARKAKLGLNEFVYFDKQRNMQMADQKKRDDEAGKNRVLDFSGLREASFDTSQLFAMNQFLRSGPCKGIVEFVFGGNRVKIFIPGSKKGKKPRPDVCIAVRLADIRVGGYAANADKMLDAAKKYMTDTINQREVVLKITSTGDSNQNKSRGGGRGRGRGRGRGGRGRGGRGGGGRGGARGGGQQEQSRNPNLDGHILLDGVNVAEYLLKEGLAQVITRRGYGGETQPLVGESATFPEFEQVAKSAEKGLWKDFQEQDESKRDAGRSRSSKTGDVVEVLVSHVDSATQFYVNQADDELMKRVLNGMEALKKSKPGLPAGRITKNKQTLCALFMGHYARCKVLKQDVREKEPVKETGQPKGKKAKAKAKAEEKNAESGDAKGLNEFWVVRFYDYGNCASVAKADFADLPMEFRIEAIPPLAVYCDLAGIAPADRRSNPGWFHEGGRQFSEWTVDAAQKLKMRILYDDQRNSTWCVDLLYKAEDGSDQSINAALARQGLVIQKRAQERPYAFKLQSEWGTPWPTEHSENVEKYFECIRSNIKLAKMDHLALFAYGDVEDDEDDLLGPRPGQEGKKARK